MRSDYRASAIASVKRDFVKKPKKPDGLRVQALGQWCAYQQYARFIVGKLVKRIDAPNLEGTTGWYKFVYDEDRKALNAAAGWSDAKCEYFFENPKFHNNA